MLRSMTGVGVGVRGGSFLACFFTVKQQHRLIFKNGQSFFFLFDKTNSCLR